MNTKNAFILGSCLIIAAMIVALALRPQASMDVGRFQMSGVPGHAYVIDTATGQVWEKYASPSSGSVDQDFSKSKIN